MHCGQHCISWEIECCIFSTSFFTTSRPGKFQLGKMDSEALAAKLGQPVPVASKVIVLAENNDLEQFIRLCGFFVKVDRDLLEQVYEAVTKKSAARDDLHDSTAVETNEQPPQHPVGAPSAGSSRTRIFIRSQKPPFLGDPPAQSAQSSVVRCPNGNLAQKALEGSALVASVKVEAERKKQVQQRTKATGTLATLETKTEKRTQNDALVYRATDRAALDAKRRELPAYKAKDELLSLIRENQVVIVVGETGSGKTTQIPQILKEAGYPRTIGCTQPRRVAAMSVAERVAQEQGVSLGGEVGYAVRFDDKTSSNTRIKFMTDGILVRECLQQDSLEKYSCIVIDEAHERALNTDLILGLLKRIMTVRSDLKVIITSATINSKLFSDYFGNAPLFTIAGRSHPVHVQNVSAPVADYVAAAVKQTLSIHLASGPGDILVFLSGQDDIEVACAEINEKLSKLEDPPPLDVLPMFSQLPPDQQARVFLPSPRNARKVIVSTNIAETSLTVDGIRYVVDAGYCKLKVYRPQYGISVLQLVPISLANATQRAGRAGRTASGWVYRMYTKNAQENEMWDEPVPEIKRTNLAHTILLLKSLGADPSEFSFLDAPDPASLWSSSYSLWTLGALDSTGGITDLGKQLSTFPMDPFMARMLLSSVDFHCSEQVLTIISMLSVPPVFQQSKQRAREINRIRDRFAIPESDHLTIANIYDEWKNHHYSDKWANENLLQTRVLKRARDIRGQLARMLESSSGKKAQSGTNEEVRRCVCAAYFHQASWAKGLQSYIGLQTSVEMKLHPSSVLAGLGHLPDYVVYHEVIATSSQYMNVVTAVEPEWLLDYGSLFYTTELESKPVRSEPSQTIPEFKPKFKRRKVAPTKKSIMRGI